MEKKFICPACKKAYTDLEGAIECAQYDLDCFKNQDAVIQRLKETREKIESDYHSLKKLIDEYNKDVETYSHLFEDNSVTKFYLDNGCSCGGNCNKTTKVEKEYKKDTIEDFLTNLLGGIQF